MKKKLLLAALIILTLLFCLLFSAKLYMSRSVANYSGDITLSGIDSTIQILFDEKGIPQVFAESDNDAFFALGYLHSSERLFQMELFRRMSSGTLSEVFGEIAYDTDLYQRKIGFDRKALEDSKSMSQELKAILESYCRGINSWLESTSVLPPEFMILNFKPEKWTPEDCVTIGLYQTWYSHALMDGDKNYQLLLEKLGPDMLELLTQFKKWSPSTVSEGFLDSLKNEGASPFRMSEASNSWVVSPEKSASGYAVHCSDPHLEISSIPNFWYVAGLRVKNSFDFIGITAPSLPLGLMGHNGHIAYAFTVASVDIIDYSKEHLNPENLQMVEGPDGTFTPMTSEKVLIQVKGEEKPRVETVYSTENGVVISQEDNSVITLKWAGFDFNSTEVLENGLKLFKVKDFENFRKTVTQTGALDTNWTYSDKSGNIGYQLGVPVPVREDIDTYSQKDTHESSVKWDGYYTLDKVPYSLNPPEGFIATCNNQIVSDSWPYPIPGFYDPYRIIRAHSLLNSKKVFSADELRSFQMDQTSGIALRWKDILKKGAEFLKNTQLAEDIKSWDGSMSVDSKMAAVFAMWKYQFTKEIFYDELEMNWKKGNSVLEAVVEQNLNEIIDDKNTDHIVESLEEISARALEKVLPKVKGKTFGEISTHTLSHPLSQVKVLNWLLKLNRGPFSKGGDAGTLNANWYRYSENENRFRAFVGTSMRFTLDWADIDDFSIYTNLGQSGNPFSPYYDSFLSIWQKGEKWVVPFSYEKVKQHSSSTLTLVPKR